MNSQAAEKIHFSIWKSKEVISGIAKKKKRKEKDLSFNNTFIDSSEWCGNGWIFRSDEQLLFF